MSKDIPTQEIGELLDVISERLPRLLDQLKKSLFSEEAGKELGRATGAFYKELIDCGIPSEDALDMAKKYVGSLQGVLDKVHSHGGGHGHGIHVSSKSD